MKRLGIDLGVLEKGAAPSRPLVPQCPGANVRVTRDGYDTMAHGGERFSTARNDIPFNDWGMARVMCSNEIERSPNPHGTMVEYGLCRSCSRQERENREMLRTRPK